jgi:hypothetical protein
MILDELWRAQRVRKRTERVFQRLIAKAEKSKDRDREQSLITEFLMERDIINDRINWIETRRLQERAENFGIPIPSISDKESWEDGYEPNTVRLRKEARLRISDQIRNERRARVDDQLLWVNRISPLIAPLSGLVGFVTGLIAGLVAVLHSH